MRHPAFRPIALIVIGSTIGVAGYGDQGSGQGGPPSKQGPGATGTPGPGEAGAAPAAGKVAP